MNEIQGCANCPSFSKSVFSCSVLKDISENISGYSMSITFKKGQELYVDGAPARGVFCIAKGKVKILKTCSEQGAIAIGHAINGDILGYQHREADSLYSNTAVCVEDTSVCFIPMKVFTGFISKSPEVMEKLLNFSIEEASVMAGKIRDLKCKTVRERVAIALVDLGKKFGETKDGVIDVDISRQHVAEISGTTIESAIRYLNEFRKEKIVSFSKKKIRIINREKILALAGYKQVQG